MTTDTTDSTLSVTETEKKYDLSISDDGGVHDPILDKWFDSMTAWTAFIQNHSTQE